MSETKNEQATKGRPVTDVDQFIDDLDGGVFKRALARGLTDAAANASTFDEKAKVVVEFVIKPTGRVTLEVKHFLSVNLPTSNGSIVEKSETSTPMYLGKGGVMTLLPNEESGDLFAQKGNGNDHD